ncbi:MAG: CDP-diacylglycerol--glycerol-3-phosphate 3-phosphatidyltransferase [Mangrovicoccus sp.]|nr:CDP-diacylglycerol--glycerol-3-phosphate 3-phosphatidyltransferase [Mangrovicoccus sp.]
MPLNIPNILTLFRLLAAPGVALAFAIWARPCADWVALALFIGASLTDWVDGYLARAWNQTSRFGAMLDPIADKAMVITALAVVMATSGLNPWVIIPASVILLREVFVSGLREFLGAEAGKLAVTKLAKWKTTVQMVALAILMLSMGLQSEHGALFLTLTETEYDAAMAARSGWIYWSGQLGGLLGQAGIALLWLAGALTAMTGWDYLSKAMPYLRDAEG